MEKLLIVLACVVLFGCNQTATTDTLTKDSSNRHSKEERNKLIVMSASRALDAEDLTGAVKDFDRGFVDYRDLIGPPIRSVDSFKAHLQKMIDENKLVFGGLKIERSVPTASGDTVLVWSAVSGSWKGTIMGQKPTGKSFRLFVSEYFLLNSEGKITEHYSTPGHAEIARQIGLKL